MFGRSESTPHYLREYRAMLHHLRRKYGDEDTAREKTVGVNYERQGRKQADMVHEYAPEGPFTLLDIGCGSGRASTALRDVERLTYTGVDILPELLEYAEKKAGRPDWKFIAIEDIALPVDDASADMVLVMSVFTHLKTAEIRQYIDEIFRVAKPGAVVFCSYLDRDFPPVVKAFRPKPLQLLLRALGRDVMLSFTSRDELSGFLESAGFVVQDVRDVETTGQHVMVARKPANVNAR